VFTAANGTAITQTEGVYNYNAGTPVITFTLRDASSVDSVGGAPKELTLTRPTDGAALSSSHVTVSQDESSVTVSYPVSVEGEYVFEAVDYAGNRNSITFVMVKQQTEGGSGGSGDSGSSGNSGSSGESGPIYIDVNNQNNQLNYNNAGSSGGGSAGGGSSEATTTSDSYNSQTTTTTNNYYNQTETGAPVEPETGTGTTKTKKAKDVTYFRFLGGKTYSNKTGNITPSKYIKEEDFRDADLDDVIVESWSESEGEAGRSSQTLTKGELLEGVKAQTEA
jgi:hypothetical protein